MRQRIEDLGRIAILVEKLMEHEFLDCYPGRAKDFWDHFQGLPEEEKFKIINSMAYARRSIFESLEEISEIANGEDRLNEWARDGVKGYLDRRMVE